MPHTWGKRLDNLTFVAGTDYVIVHEGSSQTIKKVLASAIVSDEVDIDNLIGTLPVEEAMSDLDRIVFYDAADSVAKTITLEDLSALIAASKSPILETAVTITEDYTISDGYNGLSASPVTVAEGVSVTIPSGSAWVVV